MALYKDSWKVFLKNKLCFITTVVSFIGAIVYVMKCYGAPLEIQVIVRPLTRGLELSLYVFLLIMFLSYEYFRRFQQDGVDEVAVTTKSGIGKQHLLAAYLVMALWLFVLTCLITICVIICYKYYGVADPHGEYIIHIVKNMLLQIFFVGQLGIVIAFFCSKFRNRVFVYGFLLLIIFSISPYLERIADVQSRTIGSKVNIYPIVEAFNIMPLVHTNFMPNFSFGESVLSYQVFRIFFWICLFSVGILFTRKCRVRWILLAGILTVVCFYGYAVPASKVIMNSNPNNTLAHDQYYYINGNQTKDEKADFQIQAYDMDLKIGRQLKADVTLTVDKTLKKYKMTLYHGYRIKHIYTQNHKPLKFTQKNDYFIVENGNNENVKKIRVEYEGSSPAYYANNQGTYLPGNFAYYPRAGYISLYDKDQMMLNSCFLDKDTRFTAKLSCKRKVYTNLKQKNSVYKGTCDGLTIMSGFYKEKQLKNGNSLVYNYLYDEYYYDENGKSSIDKSCEEMEKFFLQKGITDTTIFVVPNVNQFRQIDVGEKQILTQSMLELS